MLKHRFRKPALCLLILSAAIGLLGCFGSTAPDTPLKEDGVRSNENGQSQAKPKPDPVPEVGQKTKEPTAPAPAEKPDLSSPGTAIASARRAAARGDWAAFCAMLTEDSRDGIGATLLYAAFNMSKDFPPGDAKFEQEVRARFKPYHDVLKKHGITDEQVRTIAQLPNKDHNALRKHVPVKDRSALTIDLLAALAKPRVNGPLARDAVLANLQPQGDRAEAFLVTKQGRTPIHFQRVNNSWQIGLTLSLQSFFQPARTEASLTLRGHKGMIVAVAMSKDGQRIVSASQEGVVKIWEGNGAEKHSYSAGSLTGLITAIGMTDDGQRFVLSAKDPVPRIYNAATAKMELSLKGHNDYVYGSAISADGVRVVTSSFDGTIKTWDGRTGKVDITIGKMLADSGKFKVALSADGKCLAASLQDQENSVRIWNADTGAEKRVLKMHGGRLACLALSPDGKRLFVTNFNQTTIHCFDVDAGKDLFTLSGTPGIPFASLALSADGKRLAAGCANGDVQIWDALSGKELHTLHDHDGRVTSIAISGDGTRVVSGGFDQTVKVWQLP